MRQMTFDIPDDVAEQFESAVPVSKQSATVATLLLRQAHKRTLTEEQRARACDALNADEDIAQLEKDMDGLSGEGLDEYPWTESTSR